MPCPSTSASLASIYTGRSSSPKGVLDRECELVLEGDLLGLERFNLSDGVEHPEGHDRHARGGPEVSALQPARVSWIQKEAGEPSRAGV
jgi:hypothetical protein